MKYENQGSLILNVYNKTQIALLYNLYDIYKVQCYKNKAASKETQYPIAE